MASQPGGHPRVWFLDCILPASRDYPSQPVAFICPWCHACGMCAISSNHFTAGMFAVGRQALGLVAPTPAALQPMLFPFPGQWSPTAAVCLRQVLWSWLPLHHLWPMEGAMAVYVGGPEGRVIGHRRVLWPTLVLHWVGCRTPVTSDHVHHSSS